MTEQYQLPFKPGMAVAELGGDLAKATFRPNINMFPGPAVDIITDLNERFPVADASYDGLFGQYIIEHIRHKKVRGFIAECYRVLKPGGICVMVTANLLEQCKRFIARVESKELNDDDFMMIFGGNPDWVGNYHHTGFSPEWAVKLFSEAGFNEIDIVEHPNCQTDLIIEAKK